MKVVVVGATGALGRELCYEEGRRQSDLILVASDERDLNPLAADLRIRFNIKVDFQLIDLRNQNALANLATELPSDVDRYFFPIGLSMDDDEVSLPIDRIKVLFEINYFPIAAIATKVAGLKNKTKREIIGFGSIAETRGRRRNVYYTSAKRALTSLFESILHSQQETLIDGYLFQIGYMKSQQSIGKKLLFPVATPADITKTVFARIEKGQTGIYFVPVFWFLICTILKLVPQKIFNKLRF